MRRLLALLIASILLTFNFLGLTSCEQAGWLIENTPPFIDNEDDKKTPENDNTPKTENEGTIRIPTYKDYERNTIDFDNINYKRPCISKAISDFNSVSDTLRSNEIPYSDQLSSIVALESEYNDILTMSAYANIISSRNTADSYWLSEYQFITTSYPSFAKAVEELFVAAANSPHSNLFERDYFGSGLVEKYKDGGKYTDEITLLMAEEAALEAEYLSLDHSSLSNAEYDRLTTDILVNLFRVRRKISNALGYKSYATFAYETLYHDYSVKDFIDFTDDVSNFVVPVYKKLRYVFDQCYGPAGKTVSTVDLVNNTYKMLEGADPELGEIYSYMLQHSLYDIDRKNDDRFDGAFTTYLDTYNAPFIFISSTGHAEDYITMCHEFGHFADNYINYAASTSLDLSEVSSQALEMLAIKRYDGILDPATLNYLKLYEIKNAVTCLISQSFYALFEHIAYDIPLEDINEESLNGAVMEAAKRLGLNSNILNDLSYVMIPHIYLYPFYVQSYATSVTVALEIYFKEIESEGAGFEIYKNLISREDSNLSFEEYVVEVGLTSPFEKNYLKIIADKIHYNLLGSHYFKQLTEDNAA